MDRPRVMVVAGDVPTARNRSDRVLSGMVKAGVLEEGVEGTIIVGPIGRVVEERKEEW